MFKVVDRCQSSRLPCPEWWVCLSARVWSGWGLRVGVFRVLRPVREGVCCIRKVKYVVFDKYK